MASVPAAEKPKRRYAKTDVPRHISEIEAKPAKERTSDEKTVLAEFKRNIQRDTIKRRQHELTALANEIGELPKVKNSARKARAKKDLLYFLTVYFPNSTGKSEFSPEQKRAIARMQTAILDQPAWVANVLPRSFCKSTISENVIIWALLFGHKKYICFFGGDQDAGDIALESIKLELRLNPLLLEDFPEAIVPIRKLAAHASRRIGQTYKGEPTNVVYSTEKLRLAYIKGKACSGGTLETYGLGTGARGTRFRDEEGDNVRPDLVIIDDGQTDKSAKSFNQIQSRIDLIENSLSYLGGHGNETSIILNGTIIAQHDLVYRASDPQDEFGQQWMSERVSMVKKFGVNLTSYWQNEYRTILLTYDRTDPGAKARARLAATEHYRANQKRADKGFEVTWNNMPLESYEISGIQHAMNLYLTKPKSFWSECQNQPLRPTTPTLLDMDKGAIATRVSGLPEFLVPLGHSNLVFGIDVGDHILAYSVAAIKPDFTGSIIHYGTHPQQPVEYWTAQNPKIKLSDIYAGVNEERLIATALQDLIHDLLNHGWQDEHGNLMSISLGLCDGGYKIEQVAAALASFSMGDRLMMSKGIGIAARNKPMQEYDLSPNRVFRVGPTLDNIRWYMPYTGIHAGVKTVMTDTNYHKSLLACRFTQATAAAAAWNIYGKTNTQHHAYATQICSEQVIQDSIVGRTVNVWTPRPGVENHWWDTVVMCALAGSLLGCTLPDAEFIFETADKSPHLKQRAMADFQQRMQPDGTYREIQPRPIRQIGPRPQPQFTPQTPSPQYAEFQHAHMQAQAQPFNLSFRDSYESTPSLFQREY